MSRLWNRHLFHFASPKYFPFLNAGLLLRQEAVRVGELLIADIVTFISGIASIIHALQLVSVSNFD